MKIKIKNIATKEETDMLLKEISRGEGRNLYEIFRESENICEDVKLKITRGICVWYVNEIITTLFRRGSGRIKRDFTENDALLLADAIEDMDEETYQEFKDQTSKLIKEKDRELI